MQFRQADGGELNDSDTGKAKMKALHSSSAIAVNIFQYWSKINKVYEITHACGLCNKENHSAEKLVFEGKFEIDPTFSKKPNIDVVIENSDRSDFKVFAIECKFSEAYGSYKHTGLKPPYLDIKPLWKTIPNILELSKRISPDDNEYKYLHPAQLIKHILGLLKVYRKNSAFRLLYLWYDVPGEKGYLHRKEIESFADIVKSDGIKFSSITYQELIRNLANNY